MAHADALSESYIRTEIEWMRARGVEVAISAEAAAPGGVHPLPIAKELVAVARPLSESIVKFRPDVIHAHWITLPLMHAGAIEASGLPLTVRGHSFDVTIGRMIELLKLRALRRVWLFPHFAEKYQIEPVSAGWKVAPLPACYDPSIWYRSPISHPHTWKVIRAAAGLPRKGIEDFIEVARAMPDLLFGLALTATRPEWLKTLRIPPNLELALDCQREQIADWFRRSSLYLRNYDPSYHAWGSPVSVLEAMGVGLPCLLPRAAAEAFGTLATVPTYYGHGSKVPEIIEAVRAFFELDPPRPEPPSAFTTDAVLPAVLGEWKGFYS
jgi:glycosyltransferase involved in cell wall biosynthesis